MCVRGAAAGREHRAPRTLLVVSPCLRSSAQERVCAQGQGRGCFPPRELSRTLQGAREPPVLAAQPPQAAAAVAQGALHRSREAARATARCRGQVPCAQKVPTAAHHLGRRGDELLLQGEKSLRT